VTRHGAHVPVNALAEVDGSDWLSGNWQNPACGLTVVKADRVARTSARPDPARPRDQRRLLRSDLRSVTACGDGYRQYLPA
jgi:hypothetical protein